MNSTIEFHATSDELLGLVSWIGREVGARIFCTEFPPARTFEVPLASLPEVFDNPKSLSFAFSIDGSALPDDKGQLSNIIHLHAARTKGNMLRQSSIGIKSEHDATMEAWKTVRAHVNKMTIAGVVVTNPDTKARLYQRRFRFTEGARSLSQAGVVMLPFAGGNIITFEEDPNG